MVFYDAADFDFLLSLSTTVHHVILARELDTRAKDTQKLDFGKRSISCFPGFPTGRVAYRTIELRPHLTEKSNQTQFFRREAYDNRLFCFVERKDRSQLCCPSSGVP